MVALQPMQRARDQEALNLVPAEIVDVGVPVAVEALARIEMLVERRAVETRQAVRIGREVRRHPVDDHADVRRMQRVDETGEGLGRPEAGAGRKQAERLVAPRAAERMLGDRQQLDMGEAQVGEVGDEPLGGEIPQRAAVAVGAAASTIRYASRRSRSAPPRTAARRGLPSSARRSSATAAARPRPRPWRARARPAAPPDRPWPAGARRPRRRYRTCRRAPASRRGTKSSQMPDGKRRRMGWRRASHALKSPITATRSALGAHTAKRTPCTPSTVTTLAPSASASLKCRPSLNRCRSSSPSSGPKE